MKTCFNTITAGRDKPLEEIIWRSGQVGFDGLEIDQNHIADCLKRVTINELRGRLEEAGLQAPSIMAFNLAQRQPVEQVVREAKRSLDSLLSKAGIISGLDR